MRTRSSPVCAALQWPVSSREVGTGCAAMGCAAMRCDALRCDALQVPREELRLPSHAHSRRWGCCRWPYSQPRPLPPPPGAHTRRARVSSVWSTPPRLRGAGGSVETETAQPAQPTTVLVAPAPSLQPQRSHAKAADSSGSAAPFEMRFHMHMYCRPVPIPRLVAWRARACTRTPTHARYARLLEACGRAVYIYIYIYTYTYTIHAYAGGRYKAKVHLLNRSMKLAKRDIKCAIVAAAGRCACLSRPAPTHCPSPRHLDGPAALKARSGPAARPSSALRCAVAIRHPTYAEAASAGALRARLMGGALAAVAARRCCKRR